MTATRSALRRHAARSAARPTIAMPASSADAKTCSPSSTSVRPASTDSADAPATRIAWIVAIADDRHVEAHVLLRLGHLDDPHAGPGELPGAADHLVGPFHRLDRDHRLVLHGDRLADVERRRSRRPCGSRTRNPRAPRSLGARSVSTPSPGEQRLEERRRVQQLDALVAHHVGDRRNQRIGVARLEPGEHRQQRQIGHDAGEDLDVLDLPGHHRLGDAGRLENLDALAQVAERDPVKVGARRRAPPLRARETPLP